MTRPHILFAGIDGVRYDILRELDTPALGPGPRGLVDHVATDHGHLDQGGHGGDHPAERTAWIAASGPGVPVTDAPLIMEQADIAGHAHHVLGLTGQPKEFVGLPFGTRTEPARA